jgi:hypothetical protein
MSTGAEGEAENDFSHPDIPYHPLTSLSRATALRTAPNDNQKTPL